jgi:hypothetical protein
LNWTAFYAEPMLCLSMTVSRLELLCLMSSNLSSSFCSSTPN